MKKLVLCLAISVLCGGTSFAATFNCAKAVTYAAKTICNNPELNALDDQFGEIYAEVAKKVGNSEMFKQIGRGNVALRNQCKTEDCVRKWLNDSISLYSYLSFSLAPDILSQMPADIQEECADAVGSVAVGQCKTAQIDFIKARIQKTLDAIKALNVPEEDRAMCQQVYEKADKEIEKYCSFIETAGAGTSITGVIGECMIDGYLNLEKLINTKYQYLMDYAEYSAK